MRLENAATSSSGCIRHSQKTAHLAHRHPGRSRANPMANRSSAVSLPAALMMSCGARHLPSLTGSMGACTTSSFPISTWPATVRSVALWSCAALRMRGAGSASRLRSARISTSTSRWQRKGRPGSTGDWSRENLSSFRAPVSAPRSALRSIVGSIPWQSRGSRDVTETMDAPRSGAGPGSGGGGWGH